MLSGTHRTKIQILTLRSFP